MSHAVSGDPRLALENITFREPRAATLAAILGIAGVAGLGLTILGSATVGPKHVLAAYHVGLISAIGMALGSLFWVMLFHILNAKWPVTIRRQFENVMRAMWLCAILFIPLLIIEVVSRGVLFKWMDPSVTAGDVLYEHKSGFLNPPFFVLRAVLYFGIWLALIARFWGWQREQDRTGSKEPSSRARFTSAPGLLIFALSTAFAGFDWLMSLDYHFFSTMWGVYFFAGAAYSAMALNILITSLLRGAGRLEGVVTDEHGHDQGKLLFGFTVFWAYIAFSQYFLIWYSNIPEETRFMDFRQEMYPIATAALIVGHFVLPFLFLLPRPAKRKTAYVAFFAGCALAIHVLDIWWIIRPMADASLMGKGKIDAPMGASAAWIDLAAIVGVLGLFGAVVVRNVVSGPLIGVNDPRLGECLHHKNYV
jgi:hypothetical protein